MKRIFIFNWEIKTIFYISGVYTLIKNTGERFIFDEKGMDKNDLYITFLVQPENIIEDFETVIN